MLYEKSYTELQFTISILLKKYSSKIKKAYTNDFLY